MIKGYKRYCDRCGVELTKRNNVCGFELCDKCNEVLGQQLAIKNDLADEQHKGDIMEFPKTFDEFANLYGFKDKDEVYTNGSELIPVFRVKQWLEHISTTKNDSKFCPDRKAKTTNMETILHCIENECAAYKDGKCLKYNSNQEPTTKNDLGVDCISRKAAEDITWQDPSYTDPLNILTEVRDKIKELPSVTPQEPRKITLEDVKGYCKPRCLTIISNELLYELTHPKIKALGEELRKARKGIADEKVLIGYNMAVAICNKHLGENEVKE